MLRADFARAWFVLTFSATALLACSDDMVSDGSDPGLQDEPSALRLRAADGTQYTGSMTYWSREATRQEAATSALLVSATSDDGRGAIGLYLAQSRSGELAERYVIEGRFPDRDEYTKASATIDGRDYRGVRGTVVIEPSQGAVSGTFEIELATVELVTVERAPGEELEAELTLRGTFETSEVHLQCMRLGVEEPGVGTPGQADDAAAGGVQDVHHTSPFCLDIKSRLEARLPLNL